MMSQENLNLIKRLPSLDGRSIKYVWGIEDSNSVESVFVQFDNYDSICVSSQVGCALKCGFCATGLGGFQRNLSANEIIYQVDNIFDDVGFSFRNPKISFMGMGEPLLNLDAVLSAQETLK
ncbi:MAG: radical SAM protein, partial [Bacteroidales bacterium]|nr:radical SAM protein [Bacteroidales bacterium]